MPGLHTPPVAGQTLRCDPRDSSHTQQRRLLGADPVEDERWNVSDLLKCALFDAGRDRVVDGPHRVDLNSLLAKGLGNDLSQRLGIRLLRTLLSACS